MSEAKELSYRFDAAACATKAFAASVQWLAAIIDKKRGFLADRRAG